MAELCKFYKKRKYVSYDSGNTWSALNEYEMGELYEYNSPDCGDSSEQYRWAEVDGALLCVGKDSYTKEIYQVSYDGGQTWYNYYPTTYRPKNLAMTNDQFCDNAGGGHYEPYDKDGKCPCGYYWEPGLGCSPISQEAIEYCNKTQLDPLKIVKCKDFSGTLTKEDVAYYDTQHVGPAHVPYLLTSYEVGDCVTKIGDRAFEQQFVMTSITISDSVEEIGTSAFNGCYSLPTITIPSSVTIFGESVFEECGTLSSVTFNCDLTSIPRGMFNSCQALRSADFLSYNQITNIGDSAFVGCISLSSITLNNTTKSIGNYAFGRCSGLTSVSLGKVETIGGQAFSGCSSLTAVTIPNTVTSIGKSAFNGCTSLLKITLESSTPPTIDSRGYDGSFYNTNNCHLFVPCDAVDTYKAAWPEYADRISCNDTGVYYRWTVVSGVECEGYTAYEKEQKQQTNNGVAWTNVYPAEYRKGAFIEEYSNSCGFEGDRIMIGTDYSGNTYYGTACTDEDITITSTNASTYLYEYTICRSIIVGDCVTTLGDKAFSLAGDNTKSAETIILPDNISYSGGGQFSGLINLKSVNFSRTATSIPNNFFQDCYSLSSFTIPSYVTSIGDSAFYNCGINDVNIPDSVTSVGHDAFRGCSATTITVGTGVTEVAYYFAISCPNLEKIEFKGNVATIAQGVLDYCDNLKEVWFSTTVPPLLDGNALPTSGDYYILVPCGSVNDYKNAWSTYASRIVCKDDYVEGNKISMTYSGGTVKNVRCNATGTSSISSSDWQIGKYDTISDITVGECVTNINHYAFRYCSATTITLPQSITSIGTYAFDNSHITAITIPYQVTEIPKRCFSECYNLTNVEFSNGVTSIGDYAFYHCSGITQITLPPRLETIGEMAFTNIGITDITIPSGVTSISGYLFDHNDGSSSLSSVTFANGMTQLNIEYGSLPDSVQIVNLPNTLTTISGNPFGSSALTEAVIPDSVTTLTGSGIQINSSACTSITIGSGVTDFSLFRISSNIHVPSLTIKSTTVPTNFINIFGNNNTPEKIYVPCESLGAYKAAVYNEGQDPSIVESYVAGCQYVELIKFTATWSDGTVETKPCYTDTITYNDFTYYGDYISDLVVGDCVTAITSTHVNITNLRLSSSVVSITLEDDWYNTVKHYYFAQNNGLTTIGNNVSTKGLEGDLTLPEGLTTIGDNALMAAGQGYYTEPRSGVTSVSIPSTLTSIGANSLKCTNASAITVDSGNTVYDSRNDCNAIIETATDKLLVGCKSTVIPDDIKSIDDSAFISTRLSVSTLTIPSGVTSIGAYAFYECSGITEVIIPDATTTIGNYAFKYLNGAGQGGSNSLINVEIGSGITSIGSSAFGYSCKNATFTIKATTPPTLNGVPFGYDSYYPIAIYVPSGSVETYKAAQYWSNLASKIQPIPNS